MEQITVFVDTETLSEEEQEAELKLEQKGGYGHDGENQGVPEGAGGTLSERA